jgi:PAS domain S-box-containing protein
MDNEKGIPQKPIGELENAALKKAAAYYQSWVQQSSDAVIVFDETDVILEWNAAALSLFGYTSDEAKGQSLLSLIILPEQQIDYENSLAIALKRGQSLFLGRTQRMTLMHRSGQGLVVEASFLQTEIEEASHFIGVFHRLDESVPSIRMRRQIIWQNKERHWQEIEILFQSIAEDAPFPMWITDKQGLPLFTNRIWREFIGPLSKSPADINWSELIPSEEFLTVHAEYYSAMGQGQAYQGEFRLKRADGEYRWIHCVVKPCSCHQGAYIGSFVDITERTQAEQTLEARDAYFNLLLNTVPAMIWMVDQEARATFYNRSWYDFTGRTFQEERDMGWMAHVHPAQRTYVEETYLSAFNARDKVRLEYLLERQDGEYRWILDTGAPVFSEKGEFEGYIGSCIDITERKLAEQALQESEERFRNLADTSPLLIWVLDASGQVSYLNQQLLNFLGTTLEEIQREGWDSYIHPEQRQSVQTELFSALNERRPSQVEVRILRYDGEYRWWVASSAPRWDDAGNFLGLVGSSMDITERKIAEQILQESEERFRTMADAAPVSIGVYNERGEAIYFNRPTLEFVNRPMEDLQGKQWLNFLHPDDRAQVEALHLQAVFEQKPYTAEFRVYRSDGALRHFYRTAAPRFKSDGEYMGEICISVDVTEQRAAVEQFRCIFDANLIGTAVWNQNKTVIQANNAFLDMLGYTREEMEAGLINWRALTPPEYDALDEACLSRIAETGICPPYEKQYFHADGHRVDVLMGAAALEHTPGQGVAFDLDITERRKNERDLQWAMERERIRRCILELTLQAADRAYEYNIPVELQQVAEAVGEFYHADRCVIVSYVHHQKQPDIEGLAILGQYCAPEITPIVLKNISEHILVNYRQLLMALHEINAPNPERIREVLRENFSRANLSDEIIDVEVHRFMESLCQYSRLQSFLQVGIMHGGKLYGAIALHQCQAPREWTEEEIELLYEIGQHIGNAFYQAELQRNERETKKALEKSYNLIRVVNEAQGFFIIREEPYIIFEKLLNHLLTHTESGFGFIAEVLYTADKTPYMKTRFLSNIAWDEPTQRLYEEYKRKGMEFRKLDSLYGQILTTGKMLISNSPMTDPRRGGIPPGHPPLNSFMGIPLYSNGEMIGIVGIANRLGGYDEGLVQELQPYLTACSNLITATRSEELRKKLTRELKASERSLKVYAAKLERSNRDLDQFATIASHDLQAPLRKVIMFSDFIRASAGDRLPLECYDYIERIQKAVLKMQTLIMDLLALSRINRRGKPFEPVNLGRILQDVLVDLESLRAQVNGTIRVGRVMTIDADDVQMHQVLQNLLDNALKFHKPDVSPEVEIEMSPLDHQYCEITIRDNGIGFDEKHLDRIFEVFERLHGESQFGGTGMGLAIVRKIVERHGGTVTAHSVPGQGATFVVTLPIHQPFGQ